MLFRSAGDHHLGDPPPEGGDHHRVDEPGACGEVREHRALRVDRLIAGDVAAEAIVRRRIPVVGRHAGEESALSGDALGGERCLLPPHGIDRVIGGISRGGSDLEATVGIEPTIRVLQTRALPLGYVAV